MKCAPFFGSYQPWHLQILIKNIVNCARLLSTTLRAHNEVSDQTRWMLSLKVHGLVRKLINVLEIRSKDNEDVISTSLQ